MTGRDGSDSTEVRIPGMNVPNDHDVPGVLVAVSCATRKHTYLGRSAVKQERGDAWRDVASDFDLDCFEKVIRFP